MCVMDPNQPGQQLPPSQPTQEPGAYDFITNPAQPKKRSLLNGGDKKGFLIMVLGGLGIVTLLVLIGGLVFGGDSDRETLLDVAKQQSAIIEIAETGNEKAGTNQAKSLALTTQLTITTQQTDLVNQIAKTGKVKEKSYASGASSKITSELEAAELNGRFDEVFSNILKQELTEYQQEIKVANSKVSSKKAKKLLADDYEQTALLLSIPTN